MASILDTFLSRFKRPAAASKASESFVAGADPSNLPVKGGASSYRETSGFLYGEFQESRPEFALEAIKALEHYSAVNPDLSYAVDNLVQLGGTDYDISFGDGVSEEMQKEMLTHLRMKSGQWYEYADGLNSLVNQLFAQVAVTGAVSAEIVPNRSLTGVERILILSPKDIRFVWDTNTQSYLPYQKVSGLGGVLNSATLGMVALNPKTYRYKALRRFGSTPYAVPPFLSALDALLVQKEMRQSLRDMMHQFGMFGILKVLLSMPRRSPGETEEGYERKCQAYLERQVPELKAGVENGMILGFKDQHDISMTSTTQNVSGVSQLFGIVDTLVAASVKQDPSMLGRQFSTSETFARVILAKLSTQVRNYQRVVAGMLEDIFVMELLLAGYSPELVQVTFKPPMVGDQKRDEETRALQIANLQALYQQGVISQQQMAQELGYEEPDEDEPRNMTPSAPGVDPSDPEGDKTKPSNPDAQPDATEEANRLITKLSRGALEFDYADTHHHRDSYATDEEQEAELVAWMEKYGLAVSAVYQEAVRKSVQDVAKALAQLDEGATLEEVSDRLQAALLRNWQGNFPLQARAAIQKWTADVYRFYRSDKRFLGGLGTELPDAVFDLLDLRTLEFYAAADEFYLGRFITDSDTRRRISAWIRERYLAGELPIGRNSPGIREFTQQFAGVLNGEAWKIRRVIDTTVNFLRNSAGVAYMQQAGLAQFEIVGVPDRLQCAYCATLNGKRFSVLTASQRVERLVNGPVDMMPLAKPFVTSLYRNADEIKDLSSVQLQAAGVDLPGYHPSCRCRVVAVQ